MNLIDFFDAGARHHPEADCFVDLAGNAMSYAQVSAQTCRIARGLMHLGHQRGFNGAVLSGNVPAGFVAVLGIARAGGVWLPVNARNSVPSNIEFLADMDCDVLFFQKRHSEQVAEIRAQVRRIRHYICLDGKNGTDLSFEDLVSQQSAEMFGPAWDPDALAIIMGTGGTTGRSKGVMLSNRNIANTFANHMSVMTISDRMTTLAVAPITHTAGVISLPFMSRGGRVILMDGVDHQALLRTIEQERVNMLFLPPTVIYSLLAQPNVRDFDYSSLKYLIYGAAPMSPDKLIEALDVFGPVMMQIYGQSEVPAAISVLPCEAHFVDGQVAPRKRLLSAGRSLPFTRVAIMGENGQLLTTPDAVGEIVAQGDLVMRGYYKNPEATAEATTNGWHRTGDVGYFDALGYLYIVDRKKDMIITGGFNVYSSEVEAALLAHPAVKDCAVIGVPDDKWGEAVKAVLELLPGQEVTTDALIDFTKARLGSVKAPKTVDIVSQLPRSSVGKVLKKDIRAQYWHSQERAI